ncbi:diphosphoinositol polyphosphate phosphohydrolase 1-like isoform X2 [Lethenteron reissneri]|uniref:diphosphoinositol polyphosphate phosphohydrolase 1-like isoform X2 n=1 Tax=Lethenteron reissneri TaxID=7753 RepID=UPI002AB768B2|nr:diphosphoinositol polyphosphate phosphohydrolase 1-like isoform X2 [Lethenteron reissneri]
MKYKPNQTRTFDGDGYRKRAACLCFRSESEQEVLLVSSSRYPDKWIVPGGGMEPEEEASVAAMREVYEEAGVKGDLGRLLGVFEAASGAGSPWTRPSSVCRVTSPCRPRTCRSTSRAVPAGEDSAATVNNGATPTTPVVAAAAATEDKAATHPIASTPDVR